MNYRNWATGLCIGLSALTMMGCASCKKLQAPVVQQTLLAQSMGETLSKKDTLQLENDRRGYLSNVALGAGIADAVTEEKIQAAYDAKYKDAAPTIEYHAAHILVDAEDKAKDLLSQIQAGAVFAEVAKANSTDGSAASGGDLGWFGLGAMVKPFEEAVIAAKVGEVTGPVNVIGTASAASMAYYQLLLRPAGQGEWKEIARSTTAVANGVLGDGTTSCTFNGTCKQRGTVTGATIHCTDGTNGTLYFRRR